MVGRPDPEWGQRVVAVVVPRGRRGADAGATLRRVGGRRGSVPRRGPAGAARGRRAAAAAPGKPDRRVALRAAPIARSALTATPAQWVEGARPRTLPAAVAPVLVGTGARRGRSTASGRAARCSRCVVALALQVAVNYANDYSDGIRGTDADRVGPHAAGRLRREQPGATSGLAFSSIAL